MLRPRRRAHLGGARLLRWGTPRCTRRGRFGPRLWWPIFWNGGNSPRTMAVARPVRRL